MAGECNPLPALPAGEHPADELDARWAQHDLAPARAHRTSILEPREAPRPGQGSVLSPPRAGSRHRRQNVQEREAYVHLYGRRHPRADA